MTKSSIEIMLRIFNYFLHFVGLLSASFFGAFFAFLFNNRRQKKKQMDLEKASLSALIINSDVLSDRFLMLKKDMVDFRFPECLYLKKQLTKYEKNLKYPSHGLRIVEIGSHSFEYLFKCYQIEKVSFAVEMKDYVFITAYNPHIYRLFLTTNRVINDVNKIVKDLNVHIIDLSKKTTNNYEELSILCSYTENFLKLINNALYFLDLLSPLLINIGRKNFKNFRIESSEFPDEYKKYLPPKNYLKGWEHLEKMREAIIMP